MKIFLISVAAFLAAMSMNAQDTSGVNTNIADLEALVDSVFIHLDTSEVSSRLLIDKSLTHLPYDSLDGDGVVAVVDPTTWEQVYIDMGNAAVRVSDLQPVDSVLAVVRSIDSQAVPLGLLFFNFHALKDSAIADSLVILSNGQLHDVPGRPTSPYDEHRVVVATAFRDVLFESTREFLLDSRLFIRNTSDTILHLECDFDDGNGFVHLPIDTAVTISYGTLGVKSILIRMITTNDTLVASSSLTVARLTTSGNLLIAGPNTVSGIYDSWSMTSTRAYAEGYASGDILASYSHCGNGAVRKPVILVEGFDPANQLGGWDILYKYYSFVNDLNAAGYDVLILNFANGGDYVQRAAYLLEDVIADINQRKAGNGSHAENIVIGASMGGLVARYALADMEDRSVDHETRLFISFDAPQRGATVPLGVQSMFSYLRNYIPSQYRGLLGMPATRQLLMFHIWRRIYGYCHVSVGYSPDPLRTTLMSELATLGYPARSRNVALINGSDDAVGQGFNPGDKLVEGGSGWFADPSIEIWAAPDEDDACQEIFDFDLFYIIGGRFYSESISGTPPLDNAPGGHWDYHKYVTDYLKTVPVNGRNQHCFIPTVSSLDLQSQYASNLFYDVNSNDVIATGKTPFDNYYGPSSANEKHVHLDATRAALVLDQEIFGDNQYIQNRTLATQLDFEATERIFAGENVIPSGWNYPTGEVVVAIGADVEFVAGTEIRLHDGFVATGGSEFIARIDPNAPCGTFNGANVVSRSAAKVNARPMPGPLPQSPTGAAPSLRTSYIAEIRPNPTPQNAGITYYVGVSGTVDLTIYDALGRVVARLVDMHQESGYHRTTWQADGVDPGVYYCRLSTDGTMSTSQIVIAR